MTAFEDYLRQVHDLLSSVASVLTIKEQEEVRHLIDHREPAEALRVLAWIVVDENKRIPASAIAGIRDLSAGLVDENDLPDRLDDFATN